MSANRKRRYKRIAHISDSRQNHNGVLRMIVCIFQSFLRDFCTFFGPEHPEAGPIGEADRYLPSKLRSKKDNYYTVQLHRRVIAELCEILENHDLVHLHSVSPVIVLVGLILLWWRICRRRCPKAILHVHTHHIDYIIQRLKGTAFIGFLPAALALSIFVHWSLARIVDKVIFSNEWTLRQLGPWMWLWRKSRKVIIWSPEVKLDLDKVLLDSIWKDEVNGILPSGVPFLMFAGRIAPDKHLHKLIMLFAAIARRSPFRILLVIAGEGDVTSLRRLAKQLKIGELVYFLGRVKEEEVSALSLKAVGAATCCPNDTLGLALLKQMGCGLLAIAPEGTVFDEFIRQSRGGYLLTRDYERDAQSIVKILLSKRGRIQMGKRARHFVLESFSAKQYDVLDGLYDELIWASPDSEASHFVYLDSKRPDLS